MNSMIYVKNQNYIIFVCETSNDITLYAHRINKVENGEISHVRRPGAGRVGFSGLD